LRDLLRPVRAHKWLLLGVVLVAVAASIAYSVSQQRKYTATTALQFQDESKDLGVVGVAVTPTLTPAQLASGAAQTIVQPKVVNLVKSQLKSPLRTSELASEVTTTVDANANLVHIQATAPSASGAEQLANAYAAAAAQIANSSQRAVYAAAVKRLEKQAPPKTDFLATTTYKEELSRLQALSTIATPAQVVVPATKPSSPSSPKPARNAVLAGILGLMLGVLIVFVRDSLDRRLRSATDIEEHFGYALVGHVRDRALGHSPTAKDAKMAVEPADWELFRILRRNLDFLGARSTAQLIAVTSAMPEEGKTTVASFVAFTTAATGKRALLIECDLRRPVLAERLGINASPGLTDFVVGNAQPAEILQVVGFDDPISSNGSGRKAPRKGDAEQATADPTFRHQLVCITAGSGTQHPVEVLESEAFRAMLGEVRSAYDVVILDTPPLLSVVDALELIPKADAVVVCGRTAKLTREQARAGKAALDRLPERPIGLVITGTRRGDEDYSGGYYGYYA
jgi:Mrp family chromosome partitioning ATPase